MTNVKTVYLDTSAVVKLLMREPETAALRSRLRAWLRRASAALLRMEVLRAVRRAGLPRLMAEARRHLDAIDLIRLDDDLLDRAAALDPPTMGALDAIHLAAALSVGDDLATVITYDERMGAAAEALGIPVASPHQA